MEVEDTGHSMVLDADIATDKPETSSNTGDREHSGCVLDSTDINKSLDDTTRDQQESSTSAPVGDIRNVSLTSIDDTSVDSGSHDVVVKVEPMESTEIQTTDDKDNDSTSSTFEITVIKQEMVEDVDTCNVEEMDSGTQTVTNDSRGLEIHSTSKATVENNVNSSDRENDLPQGTDRLDSERNLKTPESEDDIAIVDQTTEKKTGSDISLDCVDQITDAEAEVIVIKDTVGLSKDVEERNEIVLVDPDVGDPSSLMEYRSTQKVITIDDSEDTSRDSSDSEEVLSHADQARTENTTDTQINKTNSKEREASPERERMIKMNRHGFEDVRTKGELQPEDLPPLEELTITVDESVVMVEVGNIKSIVGILVVIQSNENVPPLNDETILFVEGHKVLGQVFEVFGPVKTPWYSVRFNEADNIAAKMLEIGMPVYCAPREDAFTKFVFVDSLKRVKGSDASWEDNNEPPDKHLDFSDDEGERRAKAKRRNKKSGEHEIEDNGDGIVQRKNRKNRNRNRPQADEQNGTGPPQNHRGRGWNPFQGNQNNDCNAPPRFGVRPQNNINSNRSGGQCWPPRQDSFFNRPPSDFGGPPNFQNRPRMGQQQQSSWRPEYSNSNNRDAGNCGVPKLPFTSDPQTIRASMCGTRFGPSPRQNGPPGPMNTDFSRPPPLFQSDSEFRPANHFNGPNQWKMAPVGVNQQSKRFMDAAQTHTNNLPMNTGNHNLNVDNMPENHGNQIFNQWQENQGQGNSMLNQGQGNSMLSQGQVNPLLSQEQSVSGVGNQRYQFTNTNAGRNEDSYGFQPGQSNVSSNTQAVYNQQPPNSRNEGQNQAAKKFHYHSLNPTKSSVPHEAGPTWNQGRSNHNYGTSLNDTSQDNYRSGQTDASVPNGNVLEQQTKLTATRFMPDFHSNQQPGQMGYNRQQSNFTGPGHDSGISQGPVNTNIASNGVNNGPIDENERFVQNQNFSTGNTLNHQQCFQQHGGRNGGIGDQYGSQGFQNNSRTMEQQHQTTGQNNVNLVGNSSVGCRVGNNQAGNLKNQVMDHRYIQNDSEHY